MKISFKGKADVVDGRIGRTTAIAFAKAGAKIVITDAGGTGDTLNRIETSGEYALYVKCDMPKKPT
jgi:NAD(P)-dependent dehydrogenase (short-subunit alcohol dehydrogenase family)